jgi:hypothetical protein
MPPSRKSCSNERQGRPHQEQTSRSDWEHSFALEDKNWDGKLSSIVKALILHREWIGLCLILREHEEPHGAQPYRLGPDLEPRLDQALLDHRLW